MAGSLTVVGTGIQLAAHLTPEARFHIEHAEEVMYLVADAATGKWIDSLNPSCSSLHVFYEPGKDRRSSYKEMVEAILARVRAGVDLCVVFYGHPGVFVHPSHEAIRLSKALGVPSRMLPAISAEDCLFAEIGLDPGIQGCQSYEATDFMVRPRNFDTSTPLVLWQIGAIGETEALFSFTTRKGLRILTEFLKPHYGGDHEVVVYEASEYPIVNSKIRYVHLADLPQVEVRTLATLYVPSLSAPSVSLDLAETLRVGR
jgi:precorrin-6B methylase 1